MNNIRKDFSGEYTDDRNTVAMCSSCYELNYNINLKSSARSKISIKPKCDLSEDSKNTMIDSVKNMIDDSLPGFNEEMVLTCPNCKQNRVHIIIDKRISKIVSILNKNGLVTKFCCEGHFGTHNISHSYISFYSKESIDKFDMNNPLLNKWKIANNDGKAPYGYCLRTNRDICTINDFIDGTYLKELEEYILTCIVNKKMEE